MNKKKLGLVLLWLVLLLIPTFSVLITIGFHSSLLVTKLLRTIFIVLDALAVIFLFLNLKIILKNKYYLAFKKIFKFFVYSFLVIYAIGCTTFLFLLYGPYNGFRNWLITTAMQTMNHQHYCKWFYSDSEIAKVMGDNYVKDFDEDTDASLVDFDEKYANLNEYEKQILIHKKNALYKIIRFKVNGQQAYLAAVYDPSKISVGVTKWLGRSGQYAKDMAKENNAVLAINGGGFDDPGHNSKGANPVGITISQGKIITSAPTNGYGVIGFDKNNVLTLKKNITASQALSYGYRDAVTMNPFLIVNGESAFIKGNGGWGYAARTAIGQRKDGIVLFLVVDSNVSRTKGASMVDLTEIMQNYGAINAANLDGGTSSVMVEHGELINDPIDSTGAHKTRGIPTIFMVKK